MDSNNKTKAIKPKTIGPLIIIPVIIVTPFFTL